MPTLSGSVHSQLIAALRYLDLITPSNTPTKGLAVLVRSGGTDYQAALKGVLIASYPFLFDGQILKKITAQEMKDRFAAAGASGDTVRKCIAFFLAAARHCQVPLPPFITPSRNVRPRTIKARVGSLFAPVPASSRTDQGLSTVTRALLDKFPDFDPSWPPEIKTKWFDAFAKLMEQLNGR